MAASVTRILLLEGFAPTLSTKDIKAAFPAFEDLYRVKWINDTSLYLVFTDPRLAKSVYLSAFGNIHYRLASSPDQTVSITPYDGPDATAVIAHVDQRQSRSHAPRQLKQNNPSIEPPTPPVSPAVSMMLLAALNSGPPGALNGVNGMGGMSMLNGFGGIMGHPYNFNRSGSQNTFPPFAAHHAWPNFQYDLAAASPYARDLLMWGMSPSPSWGAIPSLVPANLQNSPVQPHTAKARKAAKPQTAQPVQPVQPKAASDPLPSHFVDDIAELPSPDELSHTDSSASSRDRSATRTPEKISIQPNIIDMAQTPDLIYTDAAFEPHPKSPSGPATPSTQSDVNNKLPSVSSDDDGFEVITHSLANMDLSSKPRSALAGSERPPKNSKDITGAGKKPLTSPPRIGNSGKRMLSHALGIRHPSLPPRVIASSNP